MSNDLSKYKSVIERQAPIEGYLKVGWDLLYIGQYQDIHSTSYIVYTLGWALDGEPKEPESSYPDLNVNATF